MLGIGVTGIGNISKIYLDNLTGMFADRVKLRAVADIAFGRAEKAAADYGVRAFDTLGEMLKSPDVGPKIDIVLNLTRPELHHTVALAAIKAGRHVYNEKPFCEKPEQAVELLHAAQEKGVRVGGAPDTFLGAGIQTCLKLIEDGWIGRPVAATAFMASRGPEHWHPSPEFFYKVGGGPMLDMGPYYLTALVSLLGPVSRVCGSAQIGLKTRTITSKPLYGKVVDVEVPTHVAGVLDFASGAVGTIITSFEVYSHSLPRIEIYGTEGSMQVPDPNTFGGPVHVRRFRDEEWHKIPLFGSYGENSRGLGVTDMAMAIGEGRPHRASGELALHVLDVMHGIHDASISGKYYKVRSKCKRPMAM